jgi:hypothetical protein
VRPSRYRRLYELAEGKELYLLTATPVNNRLIDFQHMIELFSRKQADYFKSAPLNIHSLPGHFRRMEKNLEQSLHIKSNGHPLQEGELATDLSEAEKVLSDDALFRALVVQRSRAYVKRSQEKHGGKQAIFPNRQPPKVAEYELKKTYGKLLSMVEKAFEKKKPLFSLAIYDPANYYRGDKNEIPEFDRGRQRRSSASCAPAFSNASKAQPKRSSNHANRCCSSSWPGSRFTAKPTAKNAASSGGKLSTQTWSARSSASARSLTIPTPTKMKT